MSNPTLEKIINLNSYPINQPHSTKYKKIIENARNLLNKDGCCRLSKFILENSISKMKNEVERNINKIYFTQEKHNPYFTKEDTNLPPNNPKIIFEKRESGYLNSNDLEGNSDLKYIYEQYELLKFVSDCLGVSPIYKWKDPIAKNPYSVMLPGHYFPWHFDGNEYTLSILVQKSEKGGVFEYVPDIRSKDNENFENVTKILKGGRENVKTLDLEEGDLQIFKGRFSMHRVTKIEGRKSRYIALPTYVKDPNRVNKPEHSRQVYGKVMPIHYERENIEIDGLID